MLPLKDIWSIQGNTYSDLGVRDRDPFCTKLPLTTAGAIPTTETELSNSRTNSFSLQMYPMPTAREQGKATKASYISRLAKQGLVPEGGPYEPTQPRDNITNTYQQALS